MNKFKMAVFDLDGTSANTLENLAFCANTVMEGYGLPPVEADKFRYFVGDGSKVQMQRLLGYHGRYSGSGDSNEEALLEEVFAKYIAFLSDHCSERVTIYDGLPEVLQWLKEHGTVCVVFSNKPHEQAVKVIRDVYPEGTFADVLGQSDSYPRKPDPAGALMLADRFGVKPSECLYIGDTNTDMLTGRAAGMYTVGVLWGFRDRDELEKAGADIIISTSEEIIDICKA